MTATEAWPEIRALALKKLDEQPTNICGISHIYLRRHFGLSDAAIQQVRDICASEDEELTCEDYMGDLRFRRR